MKALRISILCLFVLWSGSLYAQDFGLNLDSSAESAKTSATNLDSNLKLLEKANLWANLDFGSWGAFKMSGTVNFQKQTATGQYSGIWADLDQFKLVMGAANPQKGIDGFSMALGRDVVTDPSGYIYSNAEDGIFVDFGMGKITTNFRFGYTGLVSRQSSGVSMSLADANIAAGDGQFGPPRFVSIAELAVSDVFGQNLSLSSLVQQDMNKSSDLVAEKDDTYVSGRGGIVDTQYATLKLSGPVYSTLYHTSFFTYGMGRELNYIDSEYRYKPIQSWLWGSRLDYYQPQFYSSVASFRFLVASGDKDASRTVEGNTSGPDNGFTAITSTTLGVACSPALNNLAFFELGASAKPLVGRPILTSAKLMTFVRPVSGPSSLFGVPTGSKPYLGSEFDLSANYQLFSDLGISCSTGLFIPGDAFDSNNKGLQYSAKLAVSLSL